MSTETTFTPGQNVYLVASKSKLSELGSIANRFCAGKEVPFRGGFALEGQLLSHLGRPAAERSGAVVFDVALIKMRGFEVVAR